MIRNKEYKDFAPVIVDMGRDKLGQKIYMIGKLIGQGLRANSSDNDKDFNIYCVLTPDGQLIRRGWSKIKSVNKLEALLALYQLEEAMKKPYNNFFDPKSKNYMNLKRITKDCQPLSFSNRNNYYLRKNGYLEMDAKLFAKALAVVATEKLGKNYTAQTTCVPVETPLHTGYPQKSIHYKKMIIISPDEKSVYDKIEHEYSVGDMCRVKTNKPKETIQIKEDDILVYYDSTYNNQPEKSWAFPPKISLGEIGTRFKSSPEMFLLHAFDPFNPTSQHFLNLENVFVPNQILVADKNLNCVSHNSKYDFIKPFINSILDYEMEYQQPNLASEDMDIIVADFINAEHKKEEEKTKEN